MRGRLRPRSIIFSSLRCMLDRPSCKLLVVCSCHTGGSKHFYCCSFWQTSSRRCTAAGQGPSKHQLPSPYHPLRLAVRQPPQGCAGLLRHLLFAPGCCSPTYELACLRARPPDIQRGQISQLRLLRRPTSGDPPGVIAPSSPRCAVPAIFLPRSNGRAG